MKRKLALMMAVLLVITVMMVPGVSAATVEQYLKASYGVQILYNNQVLSSTAKPFIVNGTTYVPLRMLMESFGDKQISWDGATSRVIITSGLSQTEAMYMQQISSRNAQITELQNKVKSLEAQLATASTAVDLDDLEDDLNDDYEDYEGLDITITVSGDSEDITVKLDVDKDDWNALTLAKRENLLQDICDDIWDEAPKADISGSIKDGSTSVDTFSVDAGDDVSLDDFDLDALEDSINDDYEDYRSLDFTFTLSGNADKVTVKVDIDSDDWDDLSDTYKIRLLEYICDDIWDEDEDTDVTFSIKDGSSTIDTINVDAGDDVEL